MSYCSYNSEILKKLLFLLPEEEQRRTVIEIKNQDNQTILNKFALCGDFKSLKIILEIYPEEDRIAAIEFHNDKPPAIVESCFNAESLKLILALYPEEKKMVEVFTKGKQMLASAIYMKEAFEIIFSLYPENKRLGLLQEPKSDNNNDSLLSQITSSCCLDVFKMAINLVPEAQRYQLLQSTLKKGKLFSEYIQKSPNADFFHAFLSSLPLQDKLSCVKMPHKKYTRILDMLVSDIDMREELLTDVNDDGILALYCSVLEVIEPLIQTIANPNDLLIAEEKNEKIAIIALSQHLDKSTNEEQIKQSIISFLEHTRSNELWASQSLLLNKLLPSKESEEENTYQKRVAQLKVDWNIAPIATLIEQGSTYILSYGLFAKNNLNTSTNNDSMKVTPSI